MSCITEILKVKGEKEFLVLNIGDTPFCIEGGGVYKGYEYLVTLISRGSRCGYVAIPEDKPINYNWYDDDSDPYDVHGGITFCSREHYAKELLSISCTDLWLGFDAAHYNDQVDLVCAEKYFGETEEIKFMKNNSNGFYTETSSMMKIRSYKYMVGQCKNLIKQLVEQQAGS